MRVSSLIFVTVLSSISCLNASPGHGQETSEKKISLDIKNSTLQSILKLIEKKGGVVIMYESTQPFLKEKVDLSVKEKAVPEILDELVAGRSLKWTSRKNIYRIVKASDESNAQVENDIPRLVLPYFSAPPVAGMVVSADGQPVKGANVVIKGTKRGTSTGNRGEFILEANPGEILVISSIGYAAKEIVIGDGGHLGDIVLKVAESKLDEVQVVAYGTTSQRLSTGNVSSVKAADISKQPISNPLLALQGTTPGVFVTQSSGMAGSGVGLRVQGVNSIGAGLDPLYVVDGVPYQATMNMFTTGALRGGGSPFNYLNPADIESISILKDADATSIYGSRAANGAVLITTKKGKAGRTKVNLNMQSGRGEVARRVRLLNTEEYLEMRFEALKNDGLEPGEFDFDINGVYDQNRYTDWQDVLFGGTAEFTDLTASVSGGNANTQFLVSGGYNYQTNVIPGNFNNRKVSTHFNINHTSPNGKLNLFFTGSFLIDKNRYAGDDPTSEAMKLAPNAPALFNPDGTLNWAPFEDELTTWQNPLAFFEINAINNTTNLTGKASVSYEILKDLQLKASIGTNRFVTGANYFEPLTRLNPYQIPGGENFAKYSNSVSTGWIFEPQISYDRQVFGGKLDVFVAGTIDQRQGEMMTFEARQFGSDAEMGNPNSALVVRGAGISTNSYKANAIFGKLNYTFREKYILNLTARRDGSSRFGPANRFNNFGAVAGGWIFSNENFFKKNVEFLSFGKIRASYGTTGNDQVGDFSYLSLFGNMWSDKGYQGIKGKEPWGLSNPFLQWEETRKLTVGADLGFFNDRILLNITRYRYRSSNQLLGYALPIITGFGSIMRNFPALLQNTGWEIAVNTVNIRNKAFTWTSAFNFTRNVNKLVEFPGLESSSYWDTYIIGQPVTITRKFPYAGVNPENGLYQFYNYKGELTHTPDYVTDRTVIINRDPRFYGGLTNSFSYKGFQFDVLLQFVKQIGENYYNGWFPGVYNRNSHSNQPATVLDRWRKPGDVAKVQRFNSDFLWASTQYAYEFDGADKYTDASFIRVKNVSLSWDIPNSWRQKANIETFKLFVHCQNLFTFTKYKGLEPETANSHSVPPLRVITVGIQAVL